MVLLREATEMKKEKKVELHSYMVMIMNSSAMMYPQDSSQLSVIFSPRNQYFLQENDLGFSLINCKPVRFMSYGFRAFTINKTSEKKEKEKGSEERALRNVCATYASTRSATSCSLVRGSSSFFNSSLDSFRMLPLLSSLLNFLFLLSSP